MTSAGTRRRTGCGSAAKPSAGLTEAAYSCLKRAIIECELQPGMTVSQEGLMEQYGLSKAAVRGALARLQQEALMQALPRRGYRVAPVTLRDFEEVLAVRELIEPAVTRLAAERIGCEGLDRLATLAAISFEQGNLKSERRYLQANREFHLTIALHSGNRRLVKLMEHVLDESLRMTYLMMDFEDDSEEWKQGHEDILSALVRGDGEEAARLCRIEIEKARAAMQRAVLSDARINSVNIAGHRLESTVPDIRTKNRVTIVNKS